MKGYDEMKRKSFLGIFLMFITICVFSNKSFATENEIHVSQSIGSIRHDSGEEYYEGTGHSNWQFNLSLENPEFTVDSDEALKKENPLRPRKTPYTYYGYSIKYEDNTYEQRQDRTLNYNELKTHEKELGKEISYVRIFYGPTSEIKVHYNLLKEDGTKELLFTDEQYGKFDVFDIISLI